MIPTHQLNTGAKISQLGFGTWQIRPNSKAKQAVLTALASGYRLIDTARVYFNERGVGEAVRESGIPREDIFVTTKLWRASEGHDKALHAFDKSLERLGLDYVDLYLIHWPTPDKRLEAWQALTEIYRSGRARAIGVSNYTVRHLEELLGQTDVVPAVNQVEFHPFLYEDQRPLLDFCAKQQIIVEAYSPLAHGQGIANPVNTKIAQVVGKSPAQVMLRWAVQHDTVPIPKATGPTRIRENLDIFDFELTTAQMKQIDSLSNGTRTCWDPNNIP